MIIENGMRELNNQNGKKNEEEIEMKRALCQYLDFRKRHFIRKNIISLFI